MKCNCKPIIINCCGFGEDGNTDNGGNGWTPVLAVVVDGERRVQQVADWVGGDGDKPVAGQYVGSSGLVDDIADAINIRGENGAGTTLADLPWCFGHFQNVPWEAAKAQTAVPVSELGDNTLISGSKFLAPSDGMYFLSVGCGGFPVAAELHLMMFAEKSSFHGVIARTHTSVASADNWLNSISGAIYLLKGESMYCQIYSGKAQSGFISGELPTFSFVRIN